MPMMKSSNSRGTLSTVAEEVTNGAFHLFWGSGFATVLSAVCGILVARLLGPELYGVYSLVLIVPSFLMLFTDFGISQALTHFTALYISKEEQSCITQFLRTAFIFSLAASFIVFFIGFILADQLTSILMSRHEIVNLVRLTLILIMLQPLLILIRNALLGFGDMRGCALIDVIRQAFRLVVTPLLIIIGLNVWGAVAGYVIAFVASFLMGLMLFYKHYIRVRRSSTNLDNKVRAWKVLADMLIYGLPLYFSDTIQGFATTLRGIILAYFATDFLIGNFNTAINFATLITLISSPVATVLFPAFSKLKDNDVKVMFTYSVKYTSILIVPVTIFVSVMSKDLIFLLYGSKYSRAPLYLALYATTFLFSGLGSIVLGSFFNGIGDPEVNLKSTLLYTGVFIPVAILLTSTLQVEGLLMAIIVTMAVSTLYSLQMATRKYHVEVDPKTSAKIYLAAFLAAIPIILFTQFLALSSIVNIVASTIIYVAVYLTVIPLLKILTREDLEVLTQILAKITIIRPIVRIISIYEYKIIALYMNEL